MEDSEIKLINLYVDIHPITKKIFYVGVGSDCRIRKIKRNEYHNIILDSIHNRKFVRKIIFKNISQQKAWKIEKQIIKKCGRIIDGSGYLANIHSGGSFLGKPKNEKDWRKGRSAKEIYGENYKGPANKGKTYKQLKGQDYIDPRSKTFSIQIDDEQPIFCESERDFCGIFNCNDVLLGKIKNSKNDYYKIKRQLNSNHYFPDGSIIVLRYCDAQFKLETSIVGDIINRQKNKIENWCLLKNDKPKTKKYLNYNYKFPFTVTINDGEPIFCKSETDCCEKFKCERSLIGRIKKSPNMTYFFKKRSANSKHIFPNNSIVKFNYIK